MARFTELDHIKLHKLYKHAVKKREDAKDQSQVHIIGNMLMLTFLLHVVRKTFIKYFVGHDIALTLIWKFKEIRI